MPAISFPDASVDPYVDRAAVEFARMVRVARSAVVTSEPSVDFPSLVEGRGDTESAVRSWIQRNRSSAKLVTVEQNGTMLIPLYQLDEAFDLRPDAAEANAYLAEQGVDGWGIWQWFTEPNGWLDGRRPDSVLGAAHSTVLEVARSAFDSEA